MWRSCGAISTANARHSVRRDDPERRSVRIWPRSCVPRIRGRCSARSTYSSNRNRRPLSTAGLGSRSSSGVEGTRQIARGEFDVLAQLLSLLEALELLERLLFDLADSLAGDVERPSHLVECAGLLVAEAVAQLEHAPLAVGEILERFGQRF